MTLKPYESAKRTVIPKLNWGGESIDRFNAGETVAPLVPAWLRGEIAKPKRAKRHDGHTPATAIPKYVTYAMMESRGIFANRMALSRAIENLGFPKPVKIGRRALYVESEVLAWLASRKKSQIGGLSAAREFVSFDAKAE